MDLRRALCIGLTSTFVTSLAVTELAIAGPALTSEGISGDVDIHDRNPTLSYGKDVFDDSSRILVDAMVKDGEIAKYPIRFDFYINGNLLLSQFRSQEQPIPVGITLTKAEYPIPYNFTIVATAVTPNRTFTTTAFGSMTEADVHVEETPTPTPTSVDDTGDGTDNSGEDSTGDSTEDSTDDTADAVSGNSITSNDTTLEPVK